MSAATTLSRISRVVSALTRLRAPRPTFHVGFGSRMYAHAALNHVWCVHAGLATHVWDVKPAFLPVTGHDRISRRPLEHAP